MKRDRTSPGGSARASSSTEGTPPVAPDPGHYNNRELSWLQFNDRVLEEARDPTVPLLDRARFLAISTSNLDEFFEVRVAGLQAQLYDNLEPQDVPPDGMGPLQQLNEIARKTKDFVARQYECWQKEIRPALAAQGIHILGSDELTEKQSAYLDKFHAGQVFPVLTPLAIDPAHPFPHLHNKSINLILRLETLNQDSPRQLYSVLQVPSVLNLLLPLPNH
ncbi:MAG: hypothetical protein NVSMB14_17540 [Isosphaeraceae bacterium]